MTQDLGNVSYDSKTLQLLVGRKVMGIEYGEDEAGYQRITIEFQFGTKLVIEEMSQTGYIAVNLRG